LTYAEYGTKTEQNIEKLTYKNNSFDLFLHSETLEHVSNPEIAIGESRRVIKPTGLILFTTPVIWARKTRRRAKINNKKITYLAEPSYHGKRTDDYLVFFEYGHDIDKILGVTLTHLDWRNQNYIFVSKKAPTRIEYATKLKLRILEKLAQKRKA
jgi:SAM-dependent methyltransferase